MEGLTGDDIRALMALGSVRSDQHINNKILKLLYCWVKTVVAKQLSFVFWPVRCVPMVRTKKINRHGVVDWVCLFHTNHKKLHLNSKWKMNNKLGITFLILYALYLIWTLITALPTGNPLIKLGDCVEPAPDAACMNNIIVDDNVTTPSSL